MVTVNVQVSADEDDCYTFGGVVVDDSPNIWPNWNTADTLFTGYRFLSVAVPNGAIIDVAYIELYPDNNGEKDFHFDIDLEDIDNPTTPETGTLLDNRNLTGNAVTWQETVGIGVFNQSPSIVNAVQAVVNRGGWASGQDMCVITEDTQSSVVGRCSEYSFAPGHGAKLHIEYDIFLPPTNLVCFAVSSVQINLSWVDNSSDELGFKIERASDSSGPWDQIAIVGANVTEYSDVGLTPNTMYYYRVRAYK